jgi:hypothetical protein
LLQRLTGKAQTGGDLECGTVADEKLAMSGRRDRTGGIVREVPAPIIGLSPTRPGALPVIPPVEVAAARLPL